MPLQLFSSRRPLLALALALALLALPAPALAAEGDEADAALPDLVPVQLTASPASPKEGELTTLNATIHNAGASFNATSRVVLLLDGKVFASWQMGGLAAGGNATFRAGWTATPGDHVVEVVADWNGTVEEQDETNNRLAITVSLPKPDLVVERVSVRTRAAFPLFRGGPAYEGDTAMVTAVIRNQGAGSSGSFHVAILFDGALAGKTFVRPLAPNETREVGISLRNLSVGTHTVRFVADASGFVNETDETNNEAETTFEVLPLPVADLRVRILGIDAPTLRTDLGPIGRNPFAARTIRVEVANAGPEDLVRATLIIAVKANRSDDLPASSTVGSHEGTFSLIDPLAPGESRVIEYSWNPRGIGDFDVIAEGRAYQPDLDPSNQRDKKEDFILVGGLGIGAHLPFL